MHDAKDRVQKKLTAAAVLLVLLISTIGVIATLPHAVDAATLQSSKVKPLAALGGAGAALP